MINKNDQLIEMLLSGDFISEKELKLIQKEAEKKNLQFEELIVDKGIITDEHLGQITAEINNWHYINLRNEGISQVILKKIPEQMAKKNLAIIFDETENEIKLALNNPDCEEPLIDLMSEYHLLHI